MDLKLKGPDLTYTAAVLGLGRIGLGYDLNSEPSEIFSHTKAYLKHTGFRLIGGVDIDSKKRKTFETYSQVAAFETTAGLFDKQGGPIDCVSICTPTFIHEESIKNLLKYPVRLILLEKPLAPNLQKAQQILDSIDKPASIAVNYIRRWDPGIIEIKNIIENNILGEPTSIICLYGNGLLNGASHAVDLLHFWFGSENKSICLRSKQLESYDSSVDFILKFDAFDVFFHCLKLGQSQQGILEIDMIFTRGRIQILKNGWDIQLFHLIPESSSRGKGVLYGEPRHLNHDMNRYQYNVVDGLYSHLKNRVNLVSNGQTAMETLKTCLDIQKDSNN